MTEPMQLDPYFEIQHFDEKAEFWRTADFAFFEAEARAAYQREVADSAQPQNIRLIKLTPEIIEQAEDAPTEVDEEQEPLPVPCHEFSVSRIRGAS